MIRLETHHTDVIHEAVLDFYGKRLATCSSDRKIKIYYVKQNDFVLSAELQVHDGPVFQVKFAHPRFGGCLLASCSSDGKVVIQKEVSYGAWEIVYSHQASASVQSIDFAPNETGILSLAAACSDGWIHVLTHEQSDDRWSSKSFQDNKLGVTSLSFSPFNPIAGEQNEQRLAVGGCDSNVRVYRKQQDGGAWVCEHTLQGHTDWVNDVAFAPSVGLPYNMIASCSSDGTVLVWTQLTQSGEWKSALLHDFKPVPCHRVSWSATGTLLAVSSGDSDVSVWNQSLDNSAWVKVTDVSQDQQANSNNAGGVVDEQQQQQQQMPLYDEAPEEVVVSTSYSSEPQQGVVVNDQEQYYDNNNNYQQQELLYQQQQYQQQQYQQQQYQQQQYQQQPPMDYYGGGGMAGDVMMDPSSAYGQQQQQQYNNVQQTTTAQQYEQYHQNPQY